jgi:hypothetical protein
MWLIKIPVLRDDGAENFDSVKSAGISISSKCASCLTKFFCINLLIWYIWPIKSLMDQASHMSPLPGCSLNVWTGHVMESPT